LPTTTRHCGSAAGRVSTVPPLRQSLFHRFTPKGKNVAIKKKKPTKTPARAPSSVSRAVVLEALNAIKQEDALNFATLTFSEGGMKYSDKRRLEMLKSAMNFASLGFAYWNAYKEFELGEVS
jgi:hypothetical protein